MSEAFSGDGGAIRYQSRKIAAFGAGDWLCLAVAPTFAVMALLTGVLGGSPPDMLCAAAHDASPLSGMVPMYLLMSAFHSAPWLKLISSRRGDSPTSQDPPGHDLRDGRAAGGAVTFGRSAAILRE